MTLSICIGNLLSEKVSDYFNFCVIKFLPGWVYSSLNPGGGGWYPLPVGLYPLFAA